MIDTTSFMLDNRLQSIFLPTKTKRFHKKYQKIKQHTVKANMHQSQSLLSSFTLFNNRLFVCGHSDINSDLLPNMFTSSRFLIIKAFSLRYKSQLFIKGNLIAGTAPLSSNFK